MSVITAGTKLVSFNSPYVGKTFQSLTRLLLGRDGYIAGGKASDDGVTITIEPVTFVQRGIVAATKAIVTTLAVPIGTAPWFVLGGLADDNPDSGILLSATTDLQTALSGVVLAFKVDGRWRSPSSVDVATAAVQSAEQGVETGFELSRIGGFGVITGMQVSKGELVDTDGHRREVPPDPGLNNGALAAGLTLPRPHHVRHRLDHAVLRQREPFTAVIEHVMGGTVSDGSSVPAITLATAASPAKRAGYYAKRRGSIADQWWAWGDAANLRIQGGPAGEAFAAATLLVGTGNIITTWVAGQRAADNAVILLYVDNLNLRLVSFNPATGAQVDAPVTLVSDGGAVTHVRAAFDKNEKLHVVYEHDEATQQIYYMRCQTPAGAGFGLPDVSNRIIAGSPTGTNDTWPSIGIDRKGIVTVAYIEGVGANEFGDMVIATVDQTGETVDIKTIEAANDIGLDAGSLTTGSTSGTGVSGFVFQSLQRTAVVVTPFDEAYVLTLGKDSVNPNVGYIVLHGTDFADRNGVEAFNVGERLVTGADYTALAACAGEQGEIIFATKEVHPGNTTEMTFCTLNPRPGDTGRSGAPLLSRPLGNTMNGLVETSGFNDLFMALGPAGGVTVNYVLQQDVITSDIFTVAAEITQHHPRDVYLGSWVVPPTTSAQFNDVDPDFEIFNTRPKRMNYPVLVGSRGDYQGFNGIQEGVAFAARFGGDVVLRSGHYPLFGPLQIWGSLRGEGRAVIRMKNSGSGITLGHSTAVNAVTITGNLVESTEATFANLRPGSVITLSTSGRHIVLRNLGFDSGTGKFGVLVENNVAGVPVGPTFSSLLFAGLELSNLTIIGESTSVVAMKNAYQGRVRDLALQTSVALAITNCELALLDSVDVRQMTNTSADRSINVTGGSHNVLRRVATADGKGKLSTSSPGTHFIECTTDGADPTQPVYEIQALSAPLAKLTACTGTISGNLADFIAPLNIHTVIDNTSGPASVPLAELVGANAQTAPLLQLAGAWANRAAPQTFIDAGGEFSHHGDYLFEDFDNFDSAKWLVTTTENGIASIPGGDDVRIDEYSGTAMIGSLHATFNPDSAGVFGWITDGTGLAWKLWVVLDRFGANRKINGIVWHINRGGAGTITFNELKINRATGVSSVISSIVHNTGAVIEDVTTGLVGALDPDYYYALEVVVDAAAAGVAAIYYVHVNHVDAQREAAENGILGLAIVPMTNTDSSAQLTSKKSFGSWTSKPFFRARLHVAAVSPHGIYFVGLMPDNTGTAFFLLDPSNAIGLGASGQLRFVLVNDSLAVVSVLTGFTPALTTAFWLWIGYKSATEAYWGISTDLFSGFTHEGSLAVGAGTVRDDPFSVTLGISNVTADAAQADMAIDVVEVRNGRRVIF